MRYAARSRAHAYSTVLVPLAVVACIALFVGLFPPEPVAREIDTYTIVLAIAATMVRLLAAYVLAVLVAIPLALWAERSATFEAVLLPVYDVLESIPNLAILPLLAMFFLRLHALDAAAIVILFLNMLWSIVFALIGGLKVIPKDVIAAAKIFGLTRASYITRLILPAVFPQFVTGSILAVAAGWNLVVVAEALSVYAPSAGGTPDLYGIGSILVSTSAQGQGSAYLLAFATMIVIIALFNLLVWQKLLNYSQKFRFE